MEAPTYPPTHPSFLSPLPPAAPAGLGLTPLSGCPEMTSSPSVQYQRWPRPPTHSLGWHEDRVSPPTPPLPSSPRAHQPRLRVTSMPLSHGVKPLGLMSQLRLTTDTCHSLWSISVLSFVFYVQLRRCHRWGRTGTSCVSSATVATSSLTPEATPRLVAAPPVPYCLFQLPKTEHKYPLEIKEPIESLWKEEEARLGRNFSL